MGRVGGCVAAPQTPHPKGPADGGTAALPTGGRGKARLKRSGRNRPKGGEECGAAAATRKAKAGVAGHSRPRRRAEKHAKRPRRRRDKGANPAAAVISFVVVYTMAPAPATTTRRQPPNCGSEERGRYAAESAADTHPQTSVSRPRERGTGALRGGVRRGYAPADERQPTAGARNGGVSRRSPPRIRTRT